MRTKLQCVAALTVLVALLAACSPATSSNQNQGNTEVAVGGERFSTADEETAKLGSDAADGEFPRTVTHALGETTIESKPQRVVVLDTGELDAVLALGIKPVGMVTTEGANAVPNYLADQVSDVASVGTIQEVNVEAIAALEPDLILGTQLRAEKLYAQLAEIAPTVFAIRPGFPWKENFLLAADALGEEAQAVERLNAYADAAAALSEKVPEGETISIVRFLPEKIRLYGNLSLIGVVLKDAGLARPANQDIEDLALEISAENIDQAAGDYIFYSSYGQPDATGESAVIAGAAWQSLQAVQDGQAHRVEDDVWFLGLGPIGATQILEELEGFLS